MTADTTPTQDSAATSPDADVQRPGCTLPGCASCLTGLLLLGLAITAWSVFVFGQDNVRDALTWPRMLLVLALVVVIPLVLYKVLQLWLEGDGSQFPDIDYAWEAGVEELAKHGLTLDSLPLFLVLGSSGDQQEQSVVQAAGLDVRVRAIPEGDAALHWYATSEGIFLFCTDTSWLNAVAWLSAQKSRDAGQKTAFAAPLPALPSGAVAAPSIPVMAPLPPVAPEPVPPPAAPQLVIPPATQRGPSPGAGTISLDQFLQQQPMPTPSVPARGAHSPTSTISSPMPISLPAAAPEPAPVVYAPEPSSPLAVTSGHDAPAIVAPPDAAERLQRLQYVCQLLRRARRPLCAINGILTLLPFQSIRATPDEAEELQRAIKSDLLTVQRTLELRCPVTALITGLEEDQGFSELVRRVGPERASSQRFGKKFDVRALPLAEELAALCEHVCGAFDDWVYALFREQGALTRPGNTRLYALLCKVRCHLKPRLTELLASGFGFDRRATPDDDPFLFSGCYFAATGSTPDRQAFVRGVLDKMVEEQEFVEWTPRALATNRRLFWLSYVGLGVSAVLLVTLIVMFIGRGW